MLKKALFFLIVLASCKEAQFNQGTNTVREVQKESVPEECDGNKILNIELLSSGLSKNPINTNIKYSIELLSCDGKTPISLNQEEIYFDLNATGLYQLDLPFKLKNGDELLYSGKLVSYQGKDLFGNTGAYTYNKSDPLEISLNTNKAIMEIELLGKPINSTDGSDVVNSYFRVGESQAVMQTIPLTD